MITPKWVIMITCVKYPKSLISNFKSIRIDRLDTRRNTTRKYKKLKVTVQIDMGREHMTPAANNPHSVSISRIKKRKYMITQ